MNNIILILILSLLLSGCNTASVGIIGGADGPTAIIVGKIRKNKLLGKGLKTI